MVKLTNHELAVRLRNIADVQMDDEKAALLNDAADRLDAEQQQRERIVSGFNKLAAAFESFDKD